MTNRRRRQGSHRSLRIDALECRRVMDATSPIITAAPNPDTIGLYNRNQALALLSTDNAPGPAEIVYNFGAGETPISGDWDGDGVDTMGLYATDLSTGTFFLRNTNSSVVNDIVFEYGFALSGRMPVAGDWDGDGIDTIGVYDPTTGVFFLRNSNSAGFADIAFQFGSGNGVYVGLAGNWDGVGGDTVGLYSPAFNTFALINGNNAGIADAFFTYGADGQNSRAVVGDWDGDGDTTIGIYRRFEAVMFLRNSNTPGPGEINFPYGPPDNSGSTFFPISGDWVGPSSMSATLAPDQPELQHRRPSNTAVLSTLGSGDR